ncbi:pilus assembly PilX family protein [Pseudoteredinibacter isoporae]|uniref:MSHA biogenesis protein MshP n=1 Tax=Pseudoteredinibacter isoporae TaxID=570281 RepID=A0A7X0JUE3_9GAMM|nr:MSHA biogenesis protein MshP [Pseudoteredinibacter isoporae]MBB6522352.1 MSHA biogenesis protein MshP [Pseudoteredinibacter isoporae]NHO87885.1 MSHA biogenesis protein MshP [Pseudoteredinibacter isoporae]NIB23784.1 MSHA biogenesis protein MshP [Pseudoteredinibacter isoporae]
MFPNHFAVYRVPRKNRGFMLPLALFLVIAIAALAVGLSRSASSVPFVALQEVFSQRAFYAAESGANYGLSHLLLRSDINRTDGNTACTELSSVAITFSSDGLENCRAVISCAVQSGSLNDASYYTIDSQGSCGTAPVDASRTISVSAYIPGEP